MNANMANDEGVGIRLLPAGPPPAAGPWVKIEPGCEMPEDMEPLICARGKKAWTGWRRDGEWCDQDGLVRDPTHYAVLRMPEGIKP